MHVVTTDEARWALIVMVIAAIFELLTPQKGI
jgi:hypothetical protein